MDGNDGSFRKSLGWWLKNHEGRYAGRGLCGPQAKTATTGCSTTWKTRAAPDVPEIGVSGVSGVFSPPYAERFSILLTSRATNTGPTGREKTLKPRNPEL